jgi:glyoxylase I family protein
VDTFFGLAHLAVLVRNMTTSAQRYVRALGSEPIEGVRPGPVESGRSRQLMVHLLPRLAVHESPQHSGDLFDPSRTGLDQLSWFAGRCSQLAGASGFPWARRA